MNREYPDPGKVCPGEATARRDAPTWAAMTMSRSVATFLGAVAGLIGAFVTPGRGVPQDLPSRRAQGRPDRVLNAGIDPGSPRI